MFREGAVEAIPMAIGIAAWGLVAGVAMAKSGMGVPLSILMTLLVYAGSAQIAALPLIAADAPMWVVWATTLCVSLRFMAFSFHYRPYFAHLPLRQRMKLSFVMGDTSFALFIRRFPEPLPGRPYEDYFLGSALVTFGVWQVATITGIVLGHGIPEAWTLGFAGTMALLALTCTPSSDAPRDFRVRAPRLTPVATGWPFRVSVASAPSRLRSRSLGLSSRKRTRKTGRRGLGSSRLAMTLPMPAAISASQQGPVRPW